MANFYPFHGLRKNNDLSLSEYDRLKAEVGQVNDLVNDWPSYVQRHGLDPDVFHTQNEWAEIIFVSQASEVRYPDTYQAINLVRLWSPFTGFHLPFLDRIGSVSRFDNEITDQIRAEITSGIPLHIIELMDTLDPQERLAHVV
jgi:hypothetical protein